MTEQLLTEVLRNLPLNHASDDQIRAEYQRRGLAPAPPAIVVDYIERARDVLANRSRQWDVTGSDSVFIDEIAATLSTIASERDAALLARLREPDVQEAIAASIWDKDAGWRGLWQEASESNKEEYRAFADAARARIVEMLTP